MQKTSKEKKNSKKRKVKDIKKKVKEVKKEKNHIEGLEKDIEQAEDTEFKEFLQPISPEHAPVLKKVETPTLELNIASSPITQTKETKMDYTEKNEPQNEPKYAGAIATDNLDEKKYESEFKPPILRQTESRRLRQEILTPQREIGVQEIEDASRIETNILEQKRKDPFEVEEKKYREVKL